eukprot:TRINITY_DN3183_c0_g2_i1.p1 TRINITY_DN3183_c0_g2~~TRINITY_DN3183_c0_g2_i1.p1  ORF type:complete len:534 (+),score=119.77 TRINITY_DN3183_c0_g2_i1:35-1603(+)
MDALIWITFGVAVLLLGAGGVWHLTTLHGDFNPNRIFTVGVGVAAVWLSVAKLVMAPVDIYDVVYSDGEYAENIKVYYQLSDMVTALFCFVFLPFLYVFNSERFAEWRNGYHSVSLPWRAFVSFLFLVPGLLTLTGIILLGVFIEYDEHDSAPIQPWLEMTRNATDTENMFNILSGACGLLGLPFMIYYLGAGMAYIPAKLLEKRLSTNELFMANELLDEQLDVANQNLHGIKSTYMKDLTKSVDSTDKKRFQKAGKKLKQLEESKALLNSRTAESKWDAKKIGRMVCGALILLFVLFNMVGVSGGRVHGLLESDCGWRCAFVTPGDAGWANPVDELLAEMGYAGATVFTGALFVYMVVGCIAAFMRIGFNLACLEESLHPYTTSAQAVYLEAIMLLLVTSALTPYLVIVAPQYAVFGGVDGCYFGTYLRPAPDPSDNGTQPGEVPSFTPCLTTELSKQVFSLRITHPIFSVADLVGFFGIVSSTVFFLIWYFAKGNKRSTLPAPHSSYMTVTCAFDDVDVV